MLAPFHQLHKAGASFQLRASRRAGQQAAGSSQHMLGDLGEVKAEVASQSPGYHSPRTSVQSFTARRCLRPKYTRGSHEATQPPPPTVQRQWCSLYFHLQFSSSRVAQTAPCASPLLRSVLHFFLPTPVLSSTPLDCPDSGKCLWKKTENLSTGNQCPPGSFHAGNPQWPPPPQTPTPSQPRLYTWPPPSGISPCSSHGLGLDTMQCFSY